MEQKEYRRRVIGSRIGLAADAFALCSVVSAITYAVFELFGLE